MSLQRRINRRGAARTPPAHASQAKLSKTIRAGVENRPDKGKLNGACNRTDCQRPGATWFNTSTRAYYCEGCAREITNFTKRADGFHICFPSTGDASLDAATMKFGKEPEGLQGSRHPEGDSLKPDKGLENGACNRTACQRPLADEPEHQFMDGNLTGGPRRYYCADCAFAFDRVDADNRLRGASTLPNRITREPKVCEAAGD